MNKKGMHTLFLKHYRSIIFRYIQIVYDKFN